MTDVLEKILEDLSNIKEYEYNRGKLQKVLNLVNKHEKLTMSNLKMTWQLQELLKRRIKSL